MNKHTGSKFDDFLKEKGLLEESTAATAKRDIIKLQKAKEKLKRYLQR